MNGTQGGDSDVMLQLFISQLNIYFLPVIIVVGCVGNLLSFYVLVNVPRHQSATIYLAFLSLMDTGFLLCLLIVWLDFLQRRSLFNREGLCQIIPYITYLFSFLSVYTVVSFTVERALVTYKPFYRHKLCTTKRAKINLVCMTLFALTFYTFPLYMSGVIKHGNTTSCQPNARFMTAAFILSSVDTVITLFLPSVTIIALNIAIIIRLYHIFSSKQSTRLGRGGGVRRYEEAEPSLGGTQTHGTQTGVHTRTTRTLLTLSTVFVTLNLPSHALRIHALVLALAGVQRSKSAFLWQDLAQFIYYINFASNFFMYLLCSRSFRDMATKMVFKKAFAKIRSIWKEKEGVTEVEV